MLRSALFFAAWCAADPGFIRVGRFRLCVAPRRRAATRAGHNAYASPSPRALVRRSPPSGEGGCGPRRAKWTL